MASYSSICTASPSTASICPQPWFFPTLKGNLYHFVDSSSELRSACPAEGLLERTTNPPLTQIIISPASFRRSKRPFWPRALRAPTFDLQANLGLRCTQDVGSDTRVDALVLLPSHVHLQAPILMRLVVSSIQCVPLAVLKPHNTTKCYCKGRKSRKPPLPTSPDWQGTCCSPYHLKVGIGEPKKGQSSRVLLFWITLMSWLRGPSIRGGTSANSKNHSRWERKETSFQTAAPFPVFSPTLPSLLLTLPCWHFQDWVELLHSLSFLLPFLASLHKSACLHLSTDRTCSALHGFAGPWQWTSAPKPGCRDHVPLCLSLRVANDKEESKRRTHAGKTWV